jgi:hypothetical protein
MTGSKGEDGRMADQARARRARLARELRANLLRRKAQAGARRSPARPKDEDARER